MERHGDIPARPGDIVDAGGAVLGRHDGQHRFTVGQRRGIGIHAPEPLFVLHKDSDSGRVIVGTRDELRTDQVSIRAARLHRTGDRVNQVKLRYRQRPLSARLDGSPAEGRHRALAVHLDEAVDGAAPGQLACLMDGDLVVGWGTIDGRATPGPT
jgi:tRNA-specific 2-thiouridylase